MSRISFGFVTGGPRQVKSREALGHQPLYTARSKSSTDPRKVPTATVGLPIDRQSADAFPGSSPSLLGYPSIPSFSIFDRVSRGLACHHLVFFFFGLPLEVSKHAIDLLINLVVMNDVFASLKKDAASSCRIKKIKSAVHKKSLEAFSFVHFF